MRTGAHSSGSDKQPPGADEADIEAAEAQFRAVGRIASRLMAHFTDVLYIGADRVRSAERSGQTSSE